MKHASLLVREKPSATVPHALSAVDGMHANAPYSHHSSTNAMISKLCVHRHGASRPPALDPAPVLEFTRTQFFVLALLSQTSILFGIVLYSILPCFSRPPRRQ